MSKKRKSRRKTPWQKIIKAIPSLEKKSKDAEEALKSMKSMKEEMANAVGGGNIAGLGVGPQGEPGLTKPRPIARRGKFAGHETFVVAAETFNSLKLQKQKGKHWRKYLDEDEAYYDLREYARKHKGPIVVEDERTGACMFVRYGDIK